MELVEAYGLEELTVTDDDLSVTIKGRTAVKHPAPVASPSDLHTDHFPDVLSAEEPAAPAEPEPQPETEGNIHDIKAPLVGVFYRSPSPDSPAFVEAGDEIEVGAEVGLIEAMKVFSPIPSEVAGVVVSIPAANGKLVHEGDVLVRVRVHEE